MGCDIHIYQEIKIEEKWHFFKEIEINRDYYLFSIIASVHYECQNSLKPRGIPLDVSTIARYYCRDDDYIHSQSWLNSKEILELIDSETLALNRPSDINYPPFASDFRWVFCFDN
jgi:hypothetical protein